MRLAESVCYIHHCHRQVSTDEGFVGTAELADDMPSCTSSSATAACRLCHTSLPARRRWTNRCAATWSSRPLNTRATVDYAKSSGGHPYCAIASTAVLSSKKTPSSSWGTSLLLLLTCLMICIANVTAKVQVEVDWSPDSEIFHSDHSKITIKFVRMQDVLQFQCHSSIVLKIHMVSEEDALRCALPSGVDPSKTLIGYCRPNSGGPIIAIRNYSPIPGQPVFEDGKNYHFITTSNGTEEGMDNSEGGLCATRGMRLRIHVLKKSAAPHRPDELAAILDSSKVPRSESPKVREVHPPATYTASRLPNRSDPLKEIRQKGNAEVVNVEPINQNRFPAVLTSRSEHGHWRKVLVNNVEELTQELSLTKNPVSLRVASALARNEMPEYEISGVARVEAASPAHFPKAEFLEKRYRRPLDYEIGYDDFNAASGLSIWPLPFFLTAAVIVRYLMPMV